MITSLHIENYVLISNLDIQFQPGFSVITGETGAGKSIILGALGLILGQRADSKTIKNGASKCIIEGSFRIGDYNLQEFFTQNDLDYDNDCLIRREISGNGKSRSFINDTPVGLQQLKELGDKLIDIHSQHQNLLLSNDSFQLQVVDTIAKSEPESITYQKKYNEYKRCIQELSTLKASALQQKAESDFLQFQFNQLNEAQLTEGEQEQQEQELQLLSHAEEIKTELSKAAYLIDDENGSAMPPLKEALLALRRAEKLYPQSSEWLQRLDSCIIELKDLATEVHKTQENFDVDPAKAEHIKQRLDLLYTLEQKHRVTSVEELIELREKFDEQLQQIESLDDKIEQLQKESTQLYNEMLEAGAKLTQKRKAAFPQIEKHLVSQLKQLGMPEIRFEVRLTPRSDWSVSGNDDIQFYFSANKNSQLQPVAQTASGGEISRVMISLKSLIASAKSLPTIIFDEIDMGISGEVANSMSLIMKNLGTYMQVIAITHLPQIAAQGSSHYKVFKSNQNDSTETSIKQLSNEERITEIAGMLSGNSISQAAIENAKQLLSTFS
ncbi:DNA repair protein RecN [Paludibacter sp.]|uniref:DNA repair protein RecN n=1 Tax=Paludibacter sp. TaxID=1898105 RepID=UPI0013557A5B|nr:DNA repair protein RecN [Paludibacter sp.]MTK52188.1 DNA repair protein RecN [Paludibacter sp.]